MATVSLYLTSFLSSLRLSEASPLPALSSSAVQIPFQSKHSARTPLVVVPPRLTDHYSPVASPALKNANILFFKSPYNVEIIVDDDEPEDSLLSRFRREVFRARVIQDSKRRRFFESSQEYRKRKSREAAKKNRKWRPRVNNEKQSEQESENPKRKKAELDEEEDNWEWDLPEGDIPYCSNFRYMKEYILLIKQK